MYLQCSNVVLKKPKAKDLSPRVHFVLPSSSNYLEICTWKYTMKAKVSERQMVKIYPKSVVAPYTFFSETQINGMNTFMSMHFDLFFGKPMCRKADENLAPQLRIYSSRF